MKHLLLKSKFILLAIIVAFNFSCSTEDGADGPAGADGIDGTNGADGMDGNANVQSITLDASTFSGNYTSVAIPEITQDILDNGVILTYLNNNPNNWVPVPCPFDTIAFDFSVHVIHYLGGIDFDYGDASGSNYTIAAGDLNSLRVIIIESSSNARFTTNSKQQTYNQLSQAGIDITNYYQVCDYYGIAY
ncbi:hypothetical protein V6251_14940 [Olleya sp. Ti.3.14]|uniref:hypothetical protein n=1 Tax=Olleya sp. Ti.3.14 TaxID=3121297 RepID=UPI00311FF94C